MAEDTVPVRCDPAPRKTNGYGGWDEILHKDPNKWYTLVPKLGDVCGLDAYEARGYSIEKWDGQPNGTNLRGGKHSRRKGDVIESNGMVLMSCSMERHNEIVNFGEDGAGGQQMADVIEKQILSTRIGSTDPLSPELSKNINPDYVRFFQPRRENL
jgi:hypothetical protein